MNNIVTQYWAAKDEGDLEAAISIARNHADEFDWCGEYPDDWSEDEILQHEQPAPRYAYDGAW